jgi:hypothetical protein
METAFSFEIEMLDGSIQHVDITPHDEEDKVTLAEAYQRVIRRLHIRGTLEQVTTIGRIR